MGATLNYAAVGSALDLVAGIFKAIADTINHLNTVG